MSCGWRIADFPLRLSSDEEDELFRKMKDGDESARNQIIIRNMRLVPVVLKYFSYDCNELEDIISCGMVGLIHAVDSYDLEFGKRFAPYAIGCIRNEILKMHYRLKAKQKNDIMFDDIIYDDGCALTLEDTLADGSDVEETVEWRVCKEVVVGLVDTVLTPHQRYVICRRYGLDGNNPMTQAALAEEMNITYSGIGKVEKRAIESLKRYFDA